MTSQLSCSCIQHHSISHCCGHTSLVPGMLCWLLGVSSKQAPISCCIHPKSSSRILVQVVHFHLQPKHQPDGLFALHCVLQQGISCWWYVFIACGLVVTAKQFHSCFINMLNIAALGVKKYTKDLSSPRLWQIWCLCTNKKNVSYTKSFAAESLAFGTGKCFLIGT